MNKALPKEIIEQIMIETNDILLCNELNFYYSAKKIFEKLTTEEKVKLLTTFISQKNNDVFKLNFIQKFTKTYVFMGSFIKYQDFKVPCSFLDISCLLKNYELMEFFNKKLNLEYDYITLALAIQNGDLEITKYIHIERNIKFDLNHLDVASQINFEIFKYVYTNMSPQNFQEFEDYIIKAMDNSIERDDILLLKFLCSNHKNILNRHNEDVIVLFLTSVKYERKAVLDFLFSEHNDIFNESVVNYLHLCEYIQYCNPNLEMVEYLVEKLGYKTNIVQLFQMCMIESEDIEVSQDILVYLVKKCVIFPNNWYLSALMEISLESSKYKVFYTLLSRLNEISIDLSESFLSY